MAEGPQHALQIMETTTRFDISAAIQTWREQLATPPGLTPENRRELEAHLQDSITALRERGLSAEESFWLACRRVGHPQMLAEEFAKEDPAAVWRARVFWLAVGVCLMRFWSGLPAFLLDAAWSGFARQMAHNFFLPDWVLFYLPFRTQGLVEVMVRNQAFVALFRFGPLVFLLALLGLGRLRWVVSASRFIFQSRRRFLFAAAASLGLYYAAAVCAAIRTLGGASPGPGMPSLGFAIQFAVGSAIISALLIAVIAWLMPAERLRVKEA